jgi:hypothetical protein
MLSILSSGCQLMIKGFSFSDWVNMVAVDTNRASERSE